MHPNVAFEFHLKNLTNFCSNSMQFLNTYDERRFRKKKKRMDQSNSFLIDPEIRHYTIELCYRLYISGNN